MNKDKMLRNIAGFLLCAMLIIIIFVFVLICYSHANVNSNANTSNDEYMPTVYDRKPDTILLFDTTCSTCGGNAVSNDVKVVCFNENCQLYGIAVEMEGDMNET